MSHPGTLAEQWQHRTSCPLQLGLRVPKAAFNEMTDSQHEQVVHFKAVAVL